MSLLSDFDDIMEIFTGINYDLEELRARGICEFTDNIVVLRGMLEQFREKLAKRAPADGAKRAPKAQMKTPVAKTPAAKTPSSKSAEPKSKPTKSAAKSSPAAKKAGRQPRKSSTSSSTDQTSEEVET